MGVKPDTVAIVDLFFAMTMQASGCAAVMPRYFVDLIDTLEQVRKLHFESAGDRCESPQADLFPPEFQVEGA